MDKKGSEGSDDSSTNSTKQPKYKGKYIDVKPETYWPWNTLTLEYIDLGRYWP